MRVPSVSLIVLISLLSFASALGAPRAAPAADASCPASPCKVFVPVVLYSILPTLHSPANATAVSSLAPTLTWTPLILGSYQIQVSTDPLFTSELDYAVNTTKTVRAPIPDHIDTLITSNLKGQTTYYWRVGVTTATTTIYSPVSSFVTPVRVSSMLPGAMTILSPKQNERIKGGTVTLRWKSIPGAVLYHIRVYDANNKSYSIDQNDVQTNSLSVTGVPLGTYHWRVKALNTLGWGSYSSPDYYFTLY